MIRFEKVELNGVGTAADAFLNGVLRDVIGDEPTRAIIWAELVAGECEAWYVIKQAEVISNMITRVEQCIHTDETTLVIVALAGHDLKCFAPEIIAHAQRLGLNSIRFHTQRVALGKFLQEYGFELTEYVFNMRLNNGQIDKQERNDADDQQHTAGSG